MHNWKNKNITSCRTPLGMWINNSECVGKDLLYGRYSLPFELSGEDLPVTLKEH